MVLSYATKMGGILIIMLTSCSPCRHAMRTNSQQPFVAQTPPLTLPSVHASSPADFPGLHNVVQYAPGLLSGSAPDGENGFNTLNKMGVRTVISVDGAAPEVAEANAYGIHYVHLPIGYSGMDHRRMLELAKAAQVAQRQDPSAPVYVHCHHGKHRSAAAAAAVAVTLGYLTPEEAVARMHVSGTAANYKGLYRCAATAHPAEQMALAEVPSDFPQVWKTSGLVKSMVSVDEHFDHLKAIERAGWTTPEDHPDLVPAAEAGAIADLFRNLQDDRRVKAKPPEFRNWLTDASKNSGAVEATLIGSANDVAKLSQGFRTLSSSCKTCHAKYRD